MTGTHHLSDVCICREKARERTESVSRKSSCFQGTMVIGQEQ